MADVIPGAPAGCHDEQGALQGPHLPQGGVLQQRLIGRAGGGGGGARDACRIHGESTQSEGGAKSTQSEGGAKSVML